MMDAKRVTRFREDGYVTVPGGVPHAQVESALREINRSLGRGFSPERAAEMRASSFCPELRRAGPILDLLRCGPPWKLAESLIGAGRIQPVRAAQIAPIFPTREDEAEPLRPHLDGRHTPTNGVPAGEIHRFALLVGILLSDVPGPNCGNFSVWPGSHVLYERYFREHGPESLLAGMPPIEIGEPVPVEGRAGDVILAHWSLAHCAAPNLSPHVRHAVFFRLRHVEQPANRSRAMTDLWLEYEGLSLPR